MLGPIIADLAAWTYEHDRKQFYSRLIAGEAIPSAYGKEFLNAACINALSMPERKVEQTGHPKDPDYMGRWLMWQIMAVFTDRGNPDGMPEFHCIDKEEGYAKMFIRELVSALLRGATKSEAYHGCNSFEQISKTWSWRGTEEVKDEGLLTHVFRAWNAFYRGFDFTSTIHYAVQCPGDIHLIAVIAGAFADAMYGCRYNNIKEKYATDGLTWSFLNVSEQVTSAGFLCEMVDKMDQLSYDQRHFFKKNDALTNVERHIWTPAKSNLEHLSFSERQKTYITKAWVTGWERRYGFYLDDGWMYFYRSHVLICRFQFEKRADGSYQIAHLQDGDQGHSSSDLLPVLNGILFRGYEGI